jgi:hypothetical protein
MIKYAIDQPINKLIIAINQYVSTGDNIVGLGNSMSEWWINPSCLKYCGSSGRNAACAVPQNRMLLIKKVIITARSITLVREL